MTRLPVVSGKQLIQAIEKAGGRRLRQNGSHVPMERIVNDKSYRTVVPLHRELAKGTLADILRQIGIGKEELIRLLRR